MNRLTSYVCIAVVLLILGSNLGWASLEDWTVSGKKAEELVYKEKQALRLLPAKGTGIAWLDNVYFQDGVIEADIAAIPRFTGIVFRLQDERIYEGVYFRPQNSRHPKPEMRKRTVQYISHPRDTWFYLRGKYPGKYEGAVDLEPEEWFHVKLEIKGTTVKVFVNHQKTPCLTVKDLKLGHAAGKVGFWCGNTSGGTFANLKVRHFEEAPAKPAPIFDPNQHYLFDTMADRRSVRAFKDTPVPPAHLLQILDMARTAPTAGNQQPWKFLVIQDRDKLDQLRDACVEATVKRAQSRRTIPPEELEKIKKRAHNRVTRYLSAPVYVAVLTDKHSRYPRYNTYDGALAAGYLMITARSLGYGTVFSQDTIPYDIIKKVFAIPDHYERVCFTPIGVPEEWPKSPPKKKLEEFVVFETFVKGLNYTPPVIRKAIELPKEILSRYTGKYELQPDFVMEIKLEENKLVVLAPGQPKLPLFAEAERDFFFKVVDAQISFQVNEKGEVTGLIFIQGDRRMNAPKL
jgi:nitroreductase